MAGHRVYIMDARGYGASSRPMEMLEPPAKHPPLVRLIEVVNDIDSVVRWVQREAGAGQVALLGWATGGHWAGFYASLHPERVRQLVLYNSNCSHFGGFRPISWLTQ